MRRHSVKPFVWLAVVFCAVPLSLRAQIPSDPPTKADLLYAVANMADIFLRTAPGIMAEETLHQRGRRGLIRLLAQTQPPPPPVLLKKDPMLDDPDEFGPPKKSTRNSEAEDGADDPSGKDDHAKTVTIKLPKDFRVHDVVSEYALGQIGGARSIHEIRSIVTIDGRTISPADDARHALTIGFQSADDQLKRQLLENFDRNRLEGAVTDFGQLILLFSASMQSHYTFAQKGDQVLNNEPMTVLAYQQISGAGGLTVFRERTEQVHPTHGEIWLRSRDLVPLRITMLTEEQAPGNLTIRHEATVDYTPTAFGLAPAHIHDVQYLNDDVLVENDLQYSGYQRLTPGIVP